MLLLQYPAGPLQPHRMGDIYQAGSSLPGVLGFGTRITASCKDIDPLPFAACVVNPSLWLKQDAGVSMMRGHLRHLVGINLAFFNCGCHGGIDSLELIMTLIGYHI